MIPDPGRQKRITWSLGSINTILFRAGTSNDKIPQWGHHSFNRGMPWLISIFGTFQGTWDQPNENTGALLRCLPDMSSNIDNCEIQWPGRWNGRRIGQVSYVGCTNDWHKRHPGRKPSLRIPPPITHFRLAVYLATVRVCKAHRFKIVVCLKWEMGPHDLYTLENIPIV